MACSMGGHRAIAWALVDSMSWVQSVLAPTPLWCCELFLLSQVSRVGLTRPPGALCTPPSLKEYIPEVSSGDDRRIFAFTDKGICHALGVSQKTCLAGGGAVNRAKLQAFYFEAGPDAIRYSRATVDTDLGALATCVSGLAMVKIPIVMGERLVDALGKYEEASRHLGWALPRIAPTYGLALRVVAGFALPKADFVFDAVPPEGIDLTDI